MDSRRLGRCLQALLVREPGASDAMRAKLVIIIPHRASNQKSVSNLLASDLNFDNTFKACPVKRVSLS